MRAPLPLSELLKAEYWEYKAAFPESYEQAATMLQPVGGMDQIARAFARRVHQLLRYDSVVDEIRKTASGARVVYHQHGTRHVLDSEYVICTLPMSVLKTLAHDLAPAYRAAIAEVRYATSAKTAFYAPRRWWEQDEGIYGGLSWTSREITQILYPSHGIGQRDGVLVGSYTFGVLPQDDMGRYSVAQRLALASGEKLHAGYASKLRDGVCVAWSKVPYSAGSWAEWTPQQRGGSYRTLLEPDGAIYFAGEHLSNLMSWQEGAILSAHRTIEQLAARVRA
ncbi:MAG: flavin monoamine oxidase family protein [Sphingomonadaceae bacterium]